MELPWQNSATFLHRQLLFGADNDRVSHGFIPHQYFGENTEVMGITVLNLKALPLTTDLEKLSIQGFRRYSCVIVLRMILVFCFVFFFLYIMYFFSFFHRGFVTVS